MTLSLLYGNVPTAAREYAAAQLLRRTLHGYRRLVVYGVENERYEQALENLRFFCPELSVQGIPPLDTEPYDFLAPSAARRGRKIESLEKLYAGQIDVLVLTPGSFFELCLPPTVLLENSLGLQVGQHLTREGLLLSLRKLGYKRSESVFQAGDFAVRGGVIDLYPASAALPLRLDFLGELLESLHFFDPLSQRNCDPVSQFRLLPLSEIPPTEEGLQNFRQQYRLHTPSKRPSDPLFELVTQGGPFVELAEMWFSLFYEDPLPVIDCLKGAQLILPSGFSSLLGAFQKKIQDSYAYRLEAKEEDQPFPLAPEMLYVPLQKIQRFLEGSDTLELSPFHPSGSESFPVSLLHSFKSPFKGTDKGFSDFKNYIKETEKTIVLGLRSVRNSKLVPKLEYQSGLPVTCVENWLQVEASLGSPGILAVDCPLPEGFETPVFELYTERELTGRSENISVAKKISSQVFNVSHFQRGDFLIHESHGVGLFCGLETLSLYGEPHECLKLEYEGGDRLFLPVEHMEVLSFFSGPHSEVSLDKLGGTKWQTRKDRIKEKIKETAEKLLAIAAKRTLVEAASFSRQNTAYEEFVQGFPYVETEDQTQAILDVLGDLAEKRVMDRLVCGDVGFGKTEVALRAAFVVSAQGAQVAILAPTTLLARQHYLNFKERFASSKKGVGLISRFQSASEIKKIHEDVKSGSLSILVGTHGILSSKVCFHNLGLLIIDEEQHFGVQQKEKLKALYPCAHVLSLSATPIPRTLQLSVAGIRDLSLITTPPLKRLPVKTRVMTFDRLNIREALLREKARGGQSFFVCPHVSHLNEVYRILQEELPSHRIAVAHGQMKTQLLEDTVMKFCEGEYDILVSTHIVESGLDIPNANTMIVYRADLFGLAQLYQLRGRVGRSSLQGYAYLTLSDKKNLGVLAERRLEVMQNLEALGSGFQIATHDMDIRGMGNIVGEEQSGQIKQVGVSLYHQLLEEALQSLRGSSAEPSASEGWQPHINLGLEVMIPESYICDSSLRLQLYQKASHLRDRQETSSFLAELGERFGPPPAEVKNLLGIIDLRNLMKALLFQKLEAGPRGVLLSLYRNECPYSAVLLSFIQAQGGLLQLRADHKIVLHKSYATPLHLLEHVIALLQTLKDKVEQSRRAQTA